MTPDDRIRLFEELSSLTPQEFGKLLFAAKPPSGIVAGPATRQGDRVADLLTWAESFTGPGLIEIQALLEKLKNGTLPTGFNFSKYLTFVCQDSRYRDVCTLYTATDVLLALEAETVGRSRPESNKDVEQPEKKVEKFPVLEGLRQYALGEERKHVILAGRPGSGKSTTLKRLLLEMAEAALANNSQPIPVLVQLKGDRTVIELVLAEFRRAKMKVTEEQLDEWLLEDRLLLLLDGVNEIPSEELRRSLQTFREDNPTTPMIFTTRDLAVGGDLGVERRLAMRPLSEPQMREFVQKYLAYLGLPDHADKLLKQLKDRLREVAETPLLLKMLCDVFDPTSQQIPQSKGELFRLFDQKYDEFKDKDLPPVSADFRRFKAELLRHLAFCMMRGDTAKPTEAWLTLERNRAEQILEQWLAGRVDAPGQRAKEWLEDLLEHHLLQIAANPKEIEFHHQLFQEYYAAEELLAMLRDRHPDLVNDQRLQHFYLNHLKWTEPIGLMLSLLTDQAQTLRWIHQALSVDFILGARLAGTVNLELQDKSLELIDALPIPEHVKVELLGRTNSTRARPYLIEALDSPNIYVAETAASYLGETDNELVVGNIRERLEDISSSFFSQVSFGGPDRTGYLWTAHLNAYAHLAPRKATEFVRERIERWGMILDLVTDAAEVLIKLDADNFVSEALEKIINPQSEAEKTHYLNLIRGASSHPLIVPVISKIVDQENDAFTLKQIIHVLGKNRSELATVKLASLIKRTDGSIRLEVVNQLKKVENPTPLLIDALCKLLDESDWNVAWCSAIVLANFGDIRSLPIFLHALQHHSGAAIRSTAAKALGMLNDESCVPSLLSAFAEDISPSVRKEAAFSLSIYGRQEAIPELMEALNSGYLDDLTNAIRSLARLDLLEPLLDIVNAESAGWQTAAVELGKTGRDDVLPSLFKALINPRYEPAGEIIDLLAELADVKTIESLVSALEEPEGYTSDRYLPNRIALVLVACNPKMAAHSLPLLSSLMCKKHIQQLFWLIPTIQYYCGYYNAEIAHLKLNLTLDKTIKGAVIQNFYNEVHGVAGNVEGNQTINPPHDS